MNEEEALAVIRDVDPNRLLSQVEALTTVFNRNHPREREVLITNGCVVYLRRVVHNVFPLPVPV